MMSPPLRQRYPSPEDRPRQSTTDARDHSRAGRFGAALIAIRHVSERLCDAADFHWRASVVEFSLMFFALMIQRAAMKPFWHDEIYTIVIARLPSLHSIWAAEQAGLDIMPPLNSMLTHLVFATVGGGHILTRLPPMIGVWIWTLAAFAIVRRRSDTMTGLGAMLLTLISGAGVVAYEARGYGVMLGLLALALFCWSEAACGRRRALYLPVLSLALAAGMWTHFYAALAVFPIAVGELVRTVRTRKIDLGVLAAVTIAAVASLPLYPLLELASLQSTTYFQKTSLREIPASYIAITRGLLGPWTITLGVVVAATALVPAFVQRDRTLPRIESHEIAAAAATILIPLVAMIVAALTVSGAFVSRYAMSAVVGLSVVIPLLVSRLRNPPATVLLCLLSCVALTYAIARDVRVKGRNETPLSYRPLLTTALSKSTPVVVTGTLYLQLWYYAPPESRRWLTYLADPPSALRLVGTDSLERDYLALRDWAAVSIEDYRIFIGSHKRFYLYDPGALSWLTRRLREDRAEVREVGRETGAIMYEVSLR